MFLILKSLESEREGEQDMLPPLFLGQLVTCHLRPVSCFTPAMYMCNFALSFHFFFIVLFMDVGLAAQIEERNLRQ